MRESVSLRSATVGFRRSAECRVLLRTYEFVDAVPREFPLKERFFLLEVSVVELSRLAIVGYGLFLGSFALGYLGERID